MKTKLRRTEAGVALVLDEPLLDELGLEEGSEVEVSASGRTLTVMPAEDEAGLFRRLAK